GGEQAAGDAKLLRGEGARFRRSPESDAGGYRDPDQRQGDHGGDRHQARRREAGGPRPGQAGDGRQGQHDDRRRRRVEEGDRGAREAVADPDRGDHVGLRPGEAARAAGEAGGRRGGDQGRRGDRDGDEGEEGAGGRR